MRKISQVIILLCLTLTIHSIPLRLDEADDDKSSSSSSSEESIEIENSNNSSNQHEKTSNTNAPNPNYSPNIQKRDTSQHQGRPADHIETLTSSTQLPNHSPQNTNSDTTKNQYQKVENRDNKPPLVGASSSSSLESENQSQIRQVRDIGHQVTPSRVIAFDPTSINDTKDPHVRTGSSNSQATTRNDASNRQSRDAEDQRTPSRVIASLPSDGNSGNQPNYPTVGLNSQTTTGRSTIHQDVNTDLRVSSLVSADSTSTGGHSTSTSANENGSEKRQLRDTDGQLTPHSHSYGRLHAETTSADRSSNDEVKNVNNQVSPRRYLPSDQAGTRSDTISNRNSQGKIPDGNRQVRNVEEETSSVSSQTTESNETTLNDSSTEENEDSTKLEEGIVSSTITPGDVYSENLKAQTQISRLIRDTVVQQNTPSLLSSDISKVVTTDNPNDTNVRSGNSQANSRLPPSVLTSSSTEKIVHQDLYASGSNYQNLGNKQRILREVVAEKSGTSETPDIVQVVKLLDTPPYPKSD